MLSAYALQNSLARKPTPPSLSQLKKELQYSPQSTDTRATPLRRNTHSKSPGSMAPSLGSLLQAFDNSQSSRNTSPRSASNSNTTTHSLVIYASLTQFVSLITHYSYTRGSPVGSSGMAVVMYRGSCPSLPFFPHFFSRSCISHSYRKQWLTFTLSILSSIPSIG